MHIRFRCPADQRDCVQAAPPPPGDGCDATLQWWFDQLDVPPKPSPPYQPAAIAGRLQGGDGGTLVTVRPISRSG